MSSRMYTSILITLTIISFISFLIVVLKMNPLDDGFGGIAIFLFYMSLFFSIFGISSLIGFYIRKWFFTYEITSEDLNISLRQGIIFSMYLISILFFYDIDVLTITNVLLITFIVVLTELFFWN